METWLDHPAVHGFAVPFIVAFVLAAFLSGTRWMSFAQAGGFTASVTLAVGWSFEALTSTRKLALITVASLALCIVMERRRNPAMQIACIALLAASSTWMLWRVLAQKELQAAQTAGALCAAYVAWQVGTLLHVSLDPVRGASAAMVLALGTGVVAVLGASAVLGVVSIAAGSAAGATLVVQVLLDRPAPVGRSISLPAASAASLAAIAAVMTAALPWYALIPLMAAGPLALAARGNTFRRPLLASTLPVVPVVIAAALAWFRPS